MPQYTVTLRFMRAQAEPFGVFPTERTRKVEAEIERFDAERFRAGLDAVTVAVKNAALELGAPEAIAHEAGIQAACGNWYAKSYTDPAYTWPNPELTVRF